MQTRFRLPFRPCMPPVSQPSWRGGRQGSWRRQRSCHNKTPRTEVRGVQSITGPAANVCRRPSLSNQPFWIATPEPVLISTPLGIAQEHQADDHSHHRYSDRIPQTVVDIAGRRDHCRGHRPGTQPNVGERHVLFLDWPFLEQLLTRPARHCQRTPSFDRKSTRHSAPYASSPSEATKNQARRLIVRNSGCEKFPLRKGGSAKGAGVVCQSRKAKLRRARLFSCAQRGARNIGTGGCSSSTKGQIRQREGGRGTLFSSNVPPQRGMKTSSVGQIRPSCSPRCRNVTSSKGFRSLDQRNCDSTSGRRPTSMTKDSVHENAAPRRLRPRAGGNSRQSAAPTDTNIHLFQR